MAISTNNCQVPFTDTRCRSYLLQKVTRYSLQKLFVAKNHLLLVVKFACYSFEKKKTTAAKKKLNKDAFEILVIHILPMYTLNLKLSTPLPPIQKPVR